MDLLRQYAPQFKVVIKFIISGGASAAIDLFCLYILVDILGVHYLASAIIAFIIAVAAGFLLQKYWTFLDKASIGTHRQFIRFFTLGAINLLINSMLMYVMVDRLHLWYFMSQVLISGGLAVSNFFLYKIFIFNTDQLNEQRVE